MDLVYAVALLGLAVIFFNVFLLGDRMPHKPFWASDGTISDLWCVTITSLIAFGIAFGVQFVLTINEQAFGLTEAALVAAALVVSYLIVRAVAPRRRLAAYAAKLAPESDTGISTPTNVVTLVQRADNTQSTSAPALPKAA